MSALPEVEQFVAAVCARLGLARELGLRLSLVAEELFTNTVRHGYGKDTDDPVLLAIEASRGRITVTYEDSASRHDPFTMAAPTSDPAAVGGVGLRLIAGLSTPEYRYVDGKNRISLTIETP